MPYKLKNELVYFDIIRMRIIINNIIKGCDLPLQTIIFLLILLASTTL